MKRQSDGVVSREAMRRIQGMREKGFLGLSWADDHILLVLMSIHALLRHLLGVEASVSMCTGLTHVHG